MHNTQLQAGEEQSFGPSPGLQRTLSSGKAAGKHQGLGQQLFSCHSASPWTVSTTSCSTEGHQAWIRRVSPSLCSQVSASEGIFPRSRIPNPMHHSPLVALQQPELEADPSLGCSCCRSCPGLGAQRCQPRSPIPAPPSAPTPIHTGSGFQLGSGSSFKAKQLWTFSVPQGYMEPLRSHPPPKVPPHLHQRVDPLPGLPDEAVAPFQALLALLQAQH